MLKCIFNSDTEVFITNGLDLNFVQDRNPDTGKLFESRKETEDWVQEYAKQSNQEIFDPLIYLKESKKEEISAKCKEILCNGFESNAYHNIKKRYKSTVEDQANIATLFVSVLGRKSLPDFPTNKLYYHAEDEDFLEWEESEIIRLMTDLNNFKEYTLFRSKAIQNYIDSLSNEDDIDLINWNTKIPE